MNSKSISVPQPQFCNWVRKRRIELDLSRTELMEKIGNQISERTLIYLEDEKRDSFSEFTLSLLAKGFDLTYLQLLEEINTLKSESIRPVEVNKNKRYPLIFSSVIVLLFICILSFSTIFRNDNSNSVSKTVIHDVHILSEYHRVLIGFDKKGTKVWQNNLKTRIKKVELFDLNKDGKQEIIAATYRIRPSDEGESPGIIYIWDDRGNLISEFNTWQKSIFSAQEPLSNVGDFEIVDLENDGIIDIVVTIHGYQYHPSRVAVFNFENNTLKETASYWNPGYLFDLYIEDINNDHVQDIICTGVNNHFKKIPNFNVKDNVYCVFMLNGNNIIGQAPPYLGKDKIGSQIWYFYVTPNANNPGTKVTDVTFMGEKDKQIYIRLKNTCFFYVNYKGDIKGRYKGNICNSKSELHLVPNNIIHTN